jgi:hypothetical protein
LDEVVTGQIGIEEESLGYVINERLVSLASQLGEDPYSLQILERLHTVATMAREVPFEVNFWEAQNTYYDVLNTEYPAQKELAQQGDKAAVEWVSTFEALAQPLSVAIQADEGG